MNDYPPGYTGSLAAPPQRCPEMEDDFDLKSWAHWAEQQRQTVEWFIVEEEGNTE